MGRSRWARVRVLGGKAAGVQAPLPTSAGAPRLTFSPISVQRAQVLVVPSTAVSGTSQSWKAAPVVPGLHPCHRPGREDLRASLKRFPPVSLGWFCSPAGTRHRDRR